MVTDVLARRARRTGAQTSHPRVLVVHVQRTSGTSLRHMIEETHGRHTVFPSTARIRRHHGGRYVPPRDLLDGWSSLPAYRFLFGHCLASLGEVLPVPHARATFVREPVARSISIVQLHARTTGRAVSELVEDAQFLETHIVDLQTRVFGLGPEFARLRPQESPAATDDVLEQAIARVRTFEFVGPTETFDTSLKRFDATFGTRLTTSVRHLNSSDAGDVPRGELIERFTPLVARDAVFYDAALHHIGRH